MEANRLNLGLSLPGDNQNHDKIKTDNYNVNKPLTLKGVISRINSSNFAEPVKKELIQKASSRPASSLPEFVNNINHYVNQASKKSM